MTPATTEQVAEVALTTSKIVVVMDHIKNNRIEYLVLMAIGTMLGWTTEAVTYAQGVCA
jgi:hypothetical protein